MKQGFLWLVSMFQFSFYEIQGFGFLYLHSIEIDTLVSVVVVFPFLLSSENQEYEVITQYSYQCGRPSLERIGFSTFRRHGLLFMFSVITSQQLPTVPLRQDRSDQATSRNRNHVACIGFYHFFFFKPRWFYFILLFYVCRALLNCSVLS